MSHDQAMLAWPTPRGRRVPRVGVVSVNWNTRELVARMLFGVLRVIPRGTICDVVVVDNGSTDGSVALLERLAEDRLIDLIANSVQRYHGPAVTQGVNRLAQRAHAGRPIDLVWILDSDAFVLRPDVISRATDAMTRFNAVLAANPDDYVDAPPHITTDLLGACSTVFDPAVVWQPAHSPFLEDGEPSRQLQQDLTAAGHRIIAFPFCSHGYVLHLGRATLARVAEFHARDNRYYDWARTHRTPHFGLRPDGAALLDDFEQAYRAAVPDDNPDTLATGLTA